MPANGVAGHRARRCRTALSPADEKAVSRNGRTEPDPGQEKRPGCVEPGIAVSAVESAAGMPGRIVMSADNPHLTT